VTLVFQASINLQCESPYYTRLMYRAVCLFSVFSPVFVGILNPLTHRMDEWLIKFRDALSTHCSSETNVE